MKTTILSGLGAALSCLLVYQSAKTQGLPLSDNTSSGLSCNWTQRPASKATLDGYMNALKAYGNKPLPFPDDASKNKRIFVYNSLQNDAIVGADANITIQRLYPDIAWTSLSTGNLIDTLQKLTGSCNVGDRAGGWAFVVDNDGFVMYVQQSQDT